MLPSGTPCFRRAATGGGMVAAGCPARRRLGPARTVIRTGTKVISHRGGSDALWAR